MISERDTPLSLLNSIFTNVQAGIHPAYPTRAQPLQYFIKTRYNGTIKPLVLKEWSESAGEHESDPPESFCEGVSQNAFKRLSDYERGKLEAEIENDYIDQQRKYRLAVASLYKPYNVKEQNTDIHPISDTLHSVLVALEIVAGLNFNLWLGGPTKAGFSLFNMNNGTREIVGPLSVPQTLTAPFEHAAQSWMGRNSNDFITLCVEAMATKSSVHHSAFSDDTLAHRVLYPDQNNARTQSEPFQDFEIHSTQSMSKALESESEPSSIISTGSNEAKSRVAEAMNALDAIGTAGPRHISGNEIGTLEDTPNGDGTNKTVTLRATSSDTHSEGPRTPIAPAMLTEPDNSNRGTRKGNQANTQNKRKNPFDSEAETGNLISPFLSTIFPPSTRRSQRIVDRLPPIDWKLPANPPNRADARAGLAQHTSHRLSTRSPTSPVATPPTLITAALKRRRISESPAFPAPVHTLVQALPASADWLRDPLTHILKTDIGASYRRLVSRLIQFEKLHNFTERGTNLPSTHRPAEVGRWISSRRRNLKLGVSTEAYSKQWWRWWGFLQPAWRDFDKTGRPKAMDPVGHGAAWHSLLKPGMNGLLSVVASLYWWGCAVHSLGGSGGSKDAEDWGGAVADCSWVMEQLVVATRRMWAAESENGDPASDNETNSGDVKGEDGSDADSIEEELEVDGVDIKDEESQSDQLIED